MSGSRTCGRCDKLPTSQIEDPHHNRYGMEFVPNREGGAMNDAVQRFRCPLCGQVWSVTGGVYGLFGEYRWSRVGLATGMVA